MGEPPRDEDGEAGAEPRVVVWSRPLCHLCEDALVVVEEVCRELAEPFEVRAIDLDPEAYAAYAELIPVVTVDGEVIATWHVSREQLRAALV